MALDFLRGRQPPLVEVKRPRRAKAHSFCGFDLCWW
jgi:hypothetical protein